METLYGNKEKVKSNITEKIDNCLTQKEYINIAIDGKWGEGKSFLIDQIVKGYNSKDDNNDKNILKALVIDCWKLSELKTLDKIILSQYIKEYGAMGKVIDELKNDLPYNIIKLITKMANPSIAGSLKIVEWANEEVKKKQDENKSYNSNIIEVLKFIKDQGCEIVIIDELDRVLPNDAIEIFRQINFLNKENNQEFPMLVTCTNLNALQGSLRHVYGESYPVEAFFDKTFDIIYKIDSPVEEKFRYLLIEIDKKINNVQQIIHYRETENSLLRKMSYRKIDLLVYDIEKHNGIFRNRFISSEILFNFIINIFALKYINFGDFQVMWDNNIQKSEFDNIVVKYSLIKDYTKTEEEIYDSYKFCVSELNFINKVDGSDDLQRTSKFNPFEKLAEILKKKA